MSAPRGTPVLIAALGLTAACAQALIVRETLSVVAGTEFLIGLLMGSWLFWTGAGGLLGGRMRIGDDGGARRLLRPLALLAAVLLPVSVLLIRLARGAGGWPLGAAVPFAFSIACCVAAPAPFALAYGVFYNAASLAAAPGAVRRGIVAAYALEAAGAAAGAALFSLLLAPLLTQAESAAVVALAAAAAAGAAARRRWIALVAVAAASVAAIAMTPILDRATMSMVARGYGIERISPSRYGELTAVRDRETVSIYAGQARLVTLPPTGLAEEAVHLPLLAHPAPRSVLLVGGAAGGALGEAARHPGVELIDWIELDPALAALASGLGGLPPADGGGRARGPLLRGIEGDGRWHLARGGGSYDVIIVSAPAPSTLRWNRLYTEEFFRTARASLAPGGVLALSHPSSENYLSAELVEALAMIERTLLVVFEHQRTVPGVTASLLASSRPVEIERIPDRLGERRVPVRYLHPEELALRCSQPRLRSLRESLSRSRLTSRNTDARPLLVTLELALEWARSGGPPLAGSLAGIPAFLPAAAALAVLGGGMLAARGRAAARAAVFSVGMSAMLLQLTAMLALQSYSGLLYQVFIVMTSLFMAGAAAGASAGARRASPRRVLGAVHAGLAVLAAAVPLWLRIASGGSIPPEAGIAGFLVFPALSGALGGLYYRTVVDASYGRGGDTVPAVYYAWDLFGGVAGALIGGAVLIPVAGTAWTALFIAASNGLAALALSPRASG